MKEQLKDLSVQSKMVVKKSSGHHPLGIERISVPGSSTLFQVVKLSPFHVGQRKFFCFEVDDLDKQYLNIFNWEEKPPYPFMYTIFGSSPNVTKINN